MYLARRAMLQYLPAHRTDYEELNKRVFGKGRDDSVLGTHRRLVNGRAKDERIRKMGQYGGTVTALVRYALERKLADSALLARRGVKNPLLPEPMIATRAEQVELAVGSKYYRLPQSFTFGEGTEKLIKLLSW